MRRKNTSDFGASVSTHLTGANLSQSELARTLNTTPAYMNHLITGRKHPSAEWVELIADTLKLSEDQRKELHVKAARQHGFKL